MAESEVLFSFSEYLQCGYIVFINKNFTPCLMIVIWDLEAWGGEKRKFSESRE